MTEPMSPMPMQDIVKFVHKLERLSHPGIAMNLSAQLESMVREIIQGNMPNLSERSKAKLFENYGPLSSFSAKIDIAYALGHISAPEHRLLHAIRQIRNKFGHTIDSALDFEHSDLDDLLAKLPAPRKPDARRVVDFASAFIDCKVMLNKHLETNALIKALKERVDKRKPETSSEK
jgi:DNA-binding MltR family transcriptional regulator